MAAPEKLRSEVGAANSAASEIVPTGKVGAAGLLALDQDVIKLIEDGVIRIASLEWFLKIPEGHRFPRCQDAPPEAFIEPARMHAQHRSSPDGEYCR